MYRCEGDSFYFTLKPWCVTTYGGGEAPLPVTRDSTWVTRTNQWSHYRMRHSTVLRFHFVIRADKKRCIVNENLAWCHLNSPEYFQYDSYAGGNYSQLPRPQPPQWARQAAASAAGSCSPAGQSAAMWRSFLSQGSSAECCSLPHWQGWVTERS